MGRIIVGFFCLITLNIFASPYCMDNSKHGCIEDGYDYKKYYRVCCYCPCERYDHSYKRNRCEQCMHFNVYPREEKIPYLDQEN